MSNKKKETQAIVNAMFMEYNRIYFNNELPENTRLFFRKFSGETTGKYYKDKLSIGLSDDFIMQGDEKDKQRTIDMLKSLRVEMVHYYEDFMGMRTGKFRHSRERMEMVEHWGLDLHQVSSDNDIEEPESNEEINFEDDPENA